MAQSKLFVFGISLILAASSASASANSGHLLQRDGPFTCGQGSPLADGDLNAFASCTCNDGSTYATLAGTASCGYTAAPAPTLLSLVTIDGMTITPVSVTATNVATVAAVTVTRTTTLSGSMAVYTDVLSQRSSVVIVDGVTVAVDVPSSTPGAGNGTTASGAIVTGATRASNTTYFSTTLSATTTTTGTTTSATGKNGAEDKVGPRMAMVMAVVGACLLYPAFG